MESTETRELINMWNAAWECDTLARDYQQKADDARRRYHMLEKEAVQRAETLGVFGAQPSTTTNPAMLREHHDQIWQAIGRAAHAEWIAAHPRPDWMTA